MSISPKWLVVGSLLGMGIVFSVYDYRQWRKVETSQYGKGAEDASVFSPALLLDKLYQNQDANVRIAVPKNWDIQEKLKVPKDKTFKPSEQKTDIAVFGDGAITTTLSVQTSALSVTDAVNVIALQISPNLIEREYANTDRIHVVIISWEDGNNTHQLAAAEKEDKLFLLESVVSTSVWKIYAKTLVSMYESWVIL